jgi:pSer/pThr/pTyr-binding forkhead associated (FHA) protein
VSGDGDSAHLGTEEVPGQAPKIELANGLFEIGRVEPADIVIPIPSVSGRHAMLRVGAPLQCMCVSV